MHFINLNQTSLANMHSFTLKSMNVTIANFH